jgi:hypothetical protein
MPIEGLPDRKLHRVCSVCRRWFWPNEGVLDWPFAHGPVGWLFRSLSVALDDESRMRFFCRECHEAAAKKAAKRRQMTSYTMLTGVIIAIVGFIAYATGLLDGLLPIGR